MIKFIWDVVTLGIRTPLVVATTSSMAEELGVMVPIPTLLFCALFSEKKENTSNVVRSWKSIDFFTVVSLFLGE